MSDPIERLRAAAIRQLKDEQRRIDDARAAIQTDQTKLDAELARIQAPAPAAACPTCWITHGRHLQMRDVSAQQGKPSGSLWECPSCQFQIFGQTEGQKK